MELYNVNCMVTQLRNSGYDLGEIAKMEEPDKAIDAILAYLGKHSSARGYMYLKKTEMETMIAPLSGAESLLFQKSIYCRTYRLKLFDIIITIFCEVKNFLSEIWKSLNMKIIISTRF